MEQKQKRHPDRVPKDFSVRSLILEDPPPEAFRRKMSSKWGPITNALKIRPNRWYRLQHYERPKSASSAVTTLKRLYRGRGFEFAHYGGKLYGRYVGTESEKVTSSSGGTTTSTTLEGTPSTEHDRRVVE